LKECVFKGFLNYESGAENKEMDKSWSATYGRNWGGIAGLQRWLL